jgi:hypothetical protein
MDPRVMRARELHRRAAEHEELAGSARAARDALIREIHASGGMSYQALAAALGCSKELIRAVVKGWVGPGTRGRNSTRDRQGA